MTITDGGGGRRADDEFRRALAVFAKDLEALRIDHGQPSLREIEKNAPVARPLSVSAVSEVLNGKRLPGRDFLIALVQTLCAHDDPRRQPVSLSDPRLDPWRVRWRELQLLKSDGRRAQLTTGEHASPDVDVFPDTPRDEAPGEEEPYDIGTLEEPFPATGPDGRRIVRIFVAMPGSTMGEQAIWSSIPEIRRNLLEPVAERIAQKMGCHTELVIEKEKTATGAIHRSMFSEAFDADVYIADLSSANPNVYLELGVRWALRDGVTIPICQNVTEVRYNASSSRVIPYGPMPDELEHSIRQITEAAVTGLQSPWRVDSPVRDGSAFMLISRQEYDFLQEEMRRLREQQAEDLINAALVETSQTGRIALLREAVTRNPASAQAHFELGVVLRKEGRYAEAEQLLRTSVRLKDGFAPAWRELGLTLSKMGASDEAAIEAFDRAVALDDQDSETWATLGGLHRRLARHGRPPGSFDVIQLERSLSCYQRAGLLSGNKPYPLMNVARINLLLAGLRGTDTTPVIQQFRNLELLALFEARSTGWADAWTLFDLADTMLLTGRGAEGLTELRKAVALIPPEERQAVLTSVIEPLQDMLSISGLLAPEAADAVQGAIEECQRSLPSLG
ncbi:tetratricopeptide repeat-containing protein [Streptomyces sp. CBMA152]|uniref:tetratricopeptide repeat-containing protein n=1 Tax=Streptomyces sp. CBMA152 TaxID=1896312 RepID=UPI0016610563|nr:tetratricopeptide repeat protein [Streptomyces sp. CBMA152]MBD0741322.1 hypothetical protein [Streptomyces sp. CBMA152]